MRLKIKKTRILPTMKNVKNAIGIFFLFCAVLFMSALIYFFAVTKNVTINSQKLLLDDTNVLVYDQYGDSIKGVCALTKKQNVKIDDLPSHVKDAFLCTEDKRFYHHDGFDFRRIARATLNNLKAKSFKEGASTISQQLIKNTHLTQEKTMKRKLQEWKLTKQLENRYTKDEIFEKYLNTIYFGHHCFGIASAAEFYFQKSAAELSLSESAILAGLVKSPNRYSPFKNPQNCINRKKQVLFLMQKNNKITQKEHDYALSEPLPTKNDAVHNAGFLHFVFDELSDLSERFGFSISGTVEIETCFDQNLQAKLEERTKDVDQVDKTIMVLDNEKHLFKACISSVGNIKRQPGSLIKPLLVYAPAIEENLLSPATPILDEKVNYGGYTPENYGGKYHGYVSMREAVEKSLNVPAVKTLSSLGIERATTYMNRLNLPIEKEDLSLALALGGMQHGFSLRDVSAAYSTLANGGVYQSCGFIDNIKMNGIIVYKQPDNPSRVFSEETAYLINDVLRTTAKQGTAKKMRSLPFEVSAKTGTVGSSDGNVDAYAISYTPKEVVSVWLGNADYRKMEYSGGGLPCSILLSINEYLFQNNPQADPSDYRFIPPTNVVNVALDKLAYTNDRKLLLSDIAAPTQYTFTELFKKDTIPLNKSTSFSKPDILPPTVQIENGKVCIKLNEKSPEFYTYKIERSDQIKDTLLYHGDKFQNFTDDAVELNKTYIYTITPIYKNNVGIPQILPSISITKDDHPTPKEEDLLEKNWWDF